MKVKIERYLGFTKDCKFNRHDSWEHCYTAFGKKESQDLALHLGFFLASWGMYRGSAGLLQKSYKIHEGAIEIIKGYLYLRSEMIFADDWKKGVANLQEELMKYYGSSNFWFPRIKKKSGIKIVEKDNKIKPTDTLISKIILGTLGCLPAYDGYFLAGIEKENKNFKIRLGSDSLSQLSKIISDKDFEIKECKKIWEEYPTMKLLDMYYWQVGFDLDEKNKIALDKWLEK